MITPVSALRWTKTRVVFNPEVSDMHDVKSYVDLAKYVNMISSYLSSHK